MTFGCHSNRISGALPGHEGTAGLKLGLPWGAWTRSGTEKHHTMRDITGRQQTRTGRDPDLNQAVREGLRYEANESLRYEAAAADGVREEHPRETEQSPKSL